jgi:hypothetical protein
VTNGEIGEKLTNGEPIELPCHARVTVRKQIPVDGIFMVKIDQADDGYLIGSGAVRGKERLAYPQSIILRIKRSNLKLLGQVIGVLDKEWEGVKGGYVMDDGVVGDE